MREGDPQELFAAINKELLFAGLWPEEQPSLNYKIKGFIVAIFPTSQSIVHLLISVLFKSRNILDFSLCLAILSSFSVCLTKFLIFYAGSKKVLKMINGLGDPDMLIFPDHLKYRMKHAIKLYALLTSCARYMVAASAFVVSFYPLIERNPERPLPFPFPYNDLQSRPIFLAFLYVLQVISTLALLICYVHSELFLIGLMIFARAHFQALQDAIIHSVRTDPGRSIFDSKVGNLIKFGNMDKIINRRLSGCVKYQLAIFRYVDSIQETYAIGFFHDILYRTTVICTVGFTLVTLTAFSPYFCFLFLYFVTMMFELLIHCATANEIIIESELVGDACYAGNWEYCGPQVRKTLFLIMERAKRPCMLSAPGLAPLSLTTLVNVLSKAVSYYTVLKTLYNKDDEEQQ